MSDPEAIRLLARIEPKIEKLTEWEMGFVESIVERVAAEWELTIKQIQKLEQIAERLSR